MGAIAGSGRGPVAAPPPTLRCVSHDPTPEPPLAAPTPTAAQPVPEVKGVFASLIVATLAQLGSSCFVAAAYTPTGPVEGLTRDERLARMLADPQFVVVSLVLAQAAVVLALWKAPRRFESIPPGGMAARLGWSETAIRWREVALVFAGTLATGSIAIVPIKHLMKPGAGALEALATTANEASLSQFAVLLLVGAVIAGLVEELLFRGLVMRRLVERWGPLKGVVVTAVLFGLWHLDLEQGLVAAALGLWLGVAALWTRSTVPVALAHIGNNLVSFLGSRLFEQHPEETEPLAFVVGVVVLALCAWGLRRLTSRSAAPEVSR